VINLTNGSKISKDKIFVILLEQHFVHSSPRNPTVFVSVSGLVKVVGVGLVKVVGVGLVKVVGVGLVKVVGVGLVKVVGVGLVGLDIGFMIGFNVQVLGI
jgi:hypothetical protein